MAPFTTPNSYGATGYAPSIQQTITSPVTSQSAFAVSTIILTHGGYSSVMQYPLNINSDAVFLDRDEMAVYCRHRDQYGMESQPEKYKLVKEDVVPLQSIPQEDDLDSRIERIVRKVMKDSRTQNNRYKNNKNQNGQEANIDE